MWEKVHRESQSGGEDGQLPDFLHGTLERRRLRKGRVLTLQEQARLLHEAKCHISDQLQEVPKGVLGETHRAWWDRAKDHQNALRTMDTSYAIVKHMLNEHKGEAPDFSFKLDRAWKSSLERQIGETILIEGTPESDLMNGKS